MGDVLPLFPATSGATFDLEHRYRTRLWRTWDPARETLAWIMLNPSKAGADDDDPTIRKCLGFARRWGYGGIEVANLYTLIATDPKDLKTAISTRGQTAAIGPEGDAAILAACQRAATLVAAWGAHRFARDRILQVRELLHGAHPNIVCLGRCGNGEPRHPLMVPYAHSPLIFLR